MDFSIDDIARARERLRGILKPTPMLRSATLERMLEADIYLKPENLQKTGSFKLRGAYNRVATLSSEEARHGCPPTRRSLHGAPLRMRVRPRDCTRHEA